MISIKVEPRTKKSCIEIYHYRRGDVSATLEIGWRWGSVWINLGEDELLPAQDDILEIAEFEDYEVDVLWDGCWEDWSVSGKVSDEDALLEEIEEGWSENSWEWLDDNDWVQVDYELNIYHDWRIVDVKKHQDDETNS